MQTRGTNKSPRFELGFIQMNTKNLKHNETKMDRNASFFID